jgi:imidazolonepropionase-like amidohydrolase
MTRKQWDSIGVNGSLATCDEGYGFIQNAAITIQDGKIAWVGEQNKLPDTPENLAIDVYDLADFCIWDIKHPRELVYQLGNHPLVGVIKKGRN